MADSWYVECQSGGIVEVQDESGKLICAVEDTRIACLIAAAPDLLAACECEEALQSLKNPSLSHDHIKGVWETLGKHGWDSEDNTVEFTRNLRRQAVAKAKGV